MNSFTTLSLPLLPPSRSKRWLATITAVLLTTLGFTAIAPAAQAAPSEVTATVFDTPDVRYVNVRNGAGTEYTKIGQVNAGASVTLECYSYGSQVQGPYGATNLWYKLKGYDNGWVNDGYIYTGSDEPVTGKCEAAALTSTEQPYPVSGTRIVDDGQVWLQLFGHFYDNSGTPVVIDWSFFANNKEFVENIYDHTPVGGTYGYVSYDVAGNRAKVDWTMFNTVVGLGKFTVHRTSERCFWIEDRYDFDEDINWLLCPKAKVDTLASAAKPFDIRSSGCVDDPRVSGGGGW